MGVPGPLAGEVGPGDGAQRGGPPDGSHAPHLLGLWPFSCRDEESETRTETRSQRRGDRDEETETRRHRDEETEMRRHRGISTVLSSQCDTLDRVRTSC